LTSTMSYLRKDSVGFRPNLEIFSRLMTAHFQFTREHLR
jgi:hypothetical protein